MFLPKMIYGLFCKKGTIMYAFSLLNSNPSECKQIRDIIYKNANRFRVHAQEYKYPRDCSNTPNGPIIQSYIVCSKISEKKNGVFSRFLRGILRHSTPLLVHSSNPYPVQLRLAALGLLGLAGREPQVGAGPRLLLAPTNVGG